MHSIGISLTNPPHKPDEIAAKLLVTMSACCAVLTSARWWISELDLDLNAQWCDVERNIDVDALRWVLSASQFKSPGLDLLLLAAAEPRYDSLVPTTQLRISINGPRSNRPSTIDWELLPDQLDGEIGADFGTLIRRVWLL